MRAWIGMCLFGLALAVAAMTLGCGPTTAFPPAGDGDGDGSDGVTEPDAAVPPRGEDDDIGNPPLGCPEDLELAPNLPPEMLIVLDRSGSMEGIWSDVTGAIKQVVVDVPPEIAWGLSLFPSATEGEDGCLTDDEVSVAVATGNSGPISTAIDGSGPFGLTPTPAALAAAGTYLRAVDTPNPKYIVLITDGLPNCAPAPNCDCPPGFADNGAQQCMRVGGGPYDYYTCDIQGDLSINATYWALAGLRDDGIHTFVFGLPSSGYTDFGLDVLAPAGGEDRPTSPRYYPANTPAELGAMLASLSAGLISCSFAIPPTDGEVAGVEIDGMLVPRDPTRTEGWDYDSTGASIRVYGSWCERLQSGDAEVRAILECPDVG